MTIHSPSTACKHYHTHYSISIYNGRISRQPSNTDWQSSKCGFRSIPCVLLFQQRRTTNVTRDELLLLENGMPAKVTLQATNHTNNESTISWISRQTGNTLCDDTASRVCILQQQKTNCNVSIHAACILLHATSQDGLYIQVQDLQKEQDDLELTITPTTTTTHTTTTVESLSCLSSCLWGIDQINIHASHRLEWWGWGWCGEFISDEAIIAPPQDATPQERLAMLQRLDDLLVVPPEYQAIEGQFEDANEQDHENVLMIIVMRCYNIGIKWQEKE